jgi:hypothetical protein
VSADAVSADAVSADAVSADAVSADAVSADAARGGAKPDAIEPAVESASSYPVTTSARVAPQRAHELDREGEPGAVRPRAVAAAPADATATASGEATSEATGADAGEQDLGGVAPITGEPFAAAAGGGNLHFGEDEEREAGGGADLAEAEDAVSGVHAPAGRALEALAGRGGDMAATGRPETRGADFVDRVARVLELQDGLEAQPVTRVLLRLDDEGGAGGRVRIGLQGGVASAEIALADPVAAGRLQLRVDELARALSRQGLEPGALQVQTGPRDESRARDPERREPAWNQERSRREQKGEGER